MKKSVYASLLICAVVLLVGSCKKDKNTPAPPLVLTDAAIGITDTNAESGGTVFSDNGSAVTARGVCWSKSPNPTVADSKTTNGTGIGRFTSSLIGLTANTTYYLKAYATNAMGTGYGNEVSFATHQVVNLNIATVNIPTGTYTMGSPTTEYGRDTDEVQHQVTLSAFKMSVFEITNAQFAAFLNAKLIGPNGDYPAGAYPGRFLIIAASDNSDCGLYFSNAQWIPVEGCSNHPVNHVSWYGATEFATYAGGSLPTEAQWEYACRAGTTTPFNTGDCLSNTQANYAWSNPYNTCTNSNYRSPFATQTVGTYAPNAYGLYDMAGNVLEWCSDWYSTYPTSPQTNPTGSSTGLFRVTRGGCWGNAAQGCRSASRYHTVPNNERDDIGFRLVFPQ